MVPEAPIGELQAKELKGFEGGLFWLKERKVWALLYHPHPDLPGRSNFTVAHEFWHYVLHRKSERLEWLMRNVSGAEFRRLGVQYGGNCGRDRIDAAMAVPNACGEPGLTDSGKD